MSRQYEQRTDEELVALASEGDEIAAEHLIRNYMELVKSKARLYYMLGADREDIVQEGMIGIFKAIKNYDPDKGASFRTFADLCVNRQIITAIKAAGRRKHTPLNTSLSLDHPVADDDSPRTLGETLSAGTAADPEAVFLIGEMAQLLFSHENSFLSPFERMVLGELIHGKTYRDIARDRGRSDKSVDNAIQRIRRKLHLFFGEYSR
ncbi:MAG: RNA polymerase sporulation sigma factor SigH [Bacillota bacterium]|jgi:RNA polymerase sporulation-specific sigma factor|nr:RNA polymerase sporulation sigma factor SigH [Eubacteriales bacterium]MDI9492472.1 RNA polymerase sporulation sigma factor SigH [Bacillota bacterium]NLV69551.1 RNA polymerase sporulation sigma factor SigH [Clostridiales bacterium]HRV33992.1 RNA polymerase sporulation sigma factor SigH [Anaerovoracaceae bacterium]MDD3537455.1 RNA polymerase sporulation sigma factor SigH [Eubacteriales bacterium]